jgi:cell division protein FtsB
MKGWHNRMNSQVKTKPNLWQFIDLIKKEQTAKEAEINQMNHGEVIAPQNYKQEVKEETLAG